MAAALALAVAACGTDAASNEPPSNEPPSNAPQASEAPVTDAAVSEAPPESTATTAGLSPELTRLVGAAEQEGALNLNWAPSNADTMQPLVDAFTQAYDLDIDVELTPTPNFPANLAKLVEEYNAGQPATTDAFLGTQDHLLAGGPEGQDVFETVDWASFAPHTAEVVVGDGVGVSLLDQIPGFAYNEQEISPGEAPEELDDIPYMEQPIASTPYAAIFNLLSADEILGRERVLAHLDAFEPAGLIGCAELDRLASGEFAALWMSCGSNIVDIAVSKGAPLDSAVLGDAAVINPWYAAVPKHAVNPKAAKLWISWLVTPEAQRILFEHEFADNRLIEGSQTADQIAEYEDAGVTFTVTDYDFVREHPEVSDPQFLGQLGEQLRGGR